MYVGWSLKVSDSCIDSDSVFSFASALLRRLVREGGAARLSSLRRIGFRTQGIWNSASLGSNSLSKLDSGITIRKRNKILERTLGE